MSLQDYGRLPAELVRKIFALKYDLGRKERIQTAREYLSLALSKAARPRLHIVDRDEWSVSVTIPIQTRWLSSKTMISLRSFDASSEGWTDEVYVKTKTWIGKFTYTVWSKFEIVYEESHNRSEWDFIEMSQNILLLLFGVAPKIVTRRTNG